MKEEPVPSKPAWEVDFPIDRLEAEHVTRREFAKFLVLVSGGMCIGTAWVAVKDKLFPARQPFAKQRICKTEDLAIGKMQAFELAGSDTPYILIRLAENDWRIFEQKCTHLSCAVFYDPKLGKIACPCHHAFFDAKTGTVLQGPPPRALRRLDVAILGDEVFALPPSALPEKG
jgi:cytochrome b6-f complex iron-sulfur subunit